MFVLFEIIKKKNEAFVIIKKKMTSGAVNKNSIVDSIWKDRIERALKHICRTIDLLQRRNAV